MNSSPPTWINDGTHDLEVAAFVCEGDDLVNRIVSRASVELHRVTGNRHRGFAAALAEGSKQSLRAMVEAVYLHLKQDYHLIYEYERAFAEGTGAQQVRLPTTLLDENRGTCLDLALLFASCLTNAKLRPIVVGVRGAQGHALAAVWLVEPPADYEALLTLDSLREHLASGEMLAVECTGFVEETPHRTYKLSFDEACQEAREYLEKLASEDFGFALDVRRAWEQGAAQEDLRKALGMDRPPEDLLAGLRAALARPCRDGIFRTGGLCQGCPTKPLPDRYFLSQDAGPDRDDLHDALKRSLQALEMTPVRPSDLYWPGPTLCKLAALIAGTPFGVYELRGSDRNAALELGLAIGFGRPFVLVKRRDAEEASLLRGLNHVSLTSYLELRHHLRANFHNCLIDMVPPAAPLPAAERSTAVVAHGDLDEIDFCVSAADVLRGLGLKPTLVGHCDERLRGCLEEEGLPHEVAGGSPGAPLGGLRLDGLVEAIQSARFGIYRVDQEASPDAFLALGVALALGRPGLLVHQHGREVPADVRGVNALAFRSYGDLQKQLRRDCAILARR
jgi:hypothetical protein